MRDKNEVSRADRGQVPAPFGPSMSEVACCDCSPNPVRAAIAWAGSPDRVFVICLRGGRPILCGTASFVREEVRRRSVASCLGRTAQYVFCPAISLPSKTRGGASSHLIRVMACRCFWGNFQTLGSAAGRPHSADMLGTRGTLAPPHARSEAAQNTGSTATSTRHRGEEK